MAEENEQQEMLEESVEQQAEREVQEEQAQESAENASREDAPDGGESTDDADKQREEYGKRVQARIDKLTKQRHEALREAEQLREENRKLKSERTVEPPADDPRPNFDDYDSVQQFQQDYDSWARRQAKREGEAEPQSETGPSSDEQAALDKIENAAVSASNKYPDFDQVVRDPNLPLTQEMLVAAADTDSVADVLYHLGKNPQEAQRLSQMSGTSLVREMGRLEARLDAQASGQQAAAGTSAQTGSGAPEPIKTVQGSRASRKQGLNEIKNIDDWMAQRQAEIEAKRRR